MLRSPRPGLRARTDHEDDVARNLPKVKRFMVRPAAAQGITRKLDFDEETLTLLPQAAPARTAPSDMYVPTLLDLLLAYRSMASRDEGDRSMISKSKVSLELSPLQPVNTLLPKKRTSRIQVLPADTIDFGDSSVSRNEDSGNLDQPCKSRFRLKEGSSKGALSLRPRSIVDLPKRSRISRDDDTGTQTMQDVQFDDHSAILPEIAERPFSGIEDEIADVALTKDLVEIVEALPSVIVRKITADINRQIGAFAGVRGGITQNEMTKVVAPFFAGEAMAVVLAKIVEGAGRTSGFAIRQAVDELKKLERASSVTTPGTVRDVDEMIEALKKPTVLGNTGDAYVRLQNALPFRVTSLRTMAPVGPSVTAHFGAEKVMLSDATGQALHVKMASNQRYRKFRAEFLDLMRRLPDVVFVNQTLSFVLSSREQRIRMAVVMKIPSYYPWCRCTVSYVRVDFGADTTETLVQVRSIAAGIGMGSGYLTRFVDALQAKFQVDRN